MALKPIVGVTNRVVKLLPSRAAAAIRVLGIPGTRKRDLHKQGDSMLVNINAASSGKQNALGELGELSRARVNLSEFRYNRSAEIYGEAEPADYIYQVVEGAVRSYKLLSDGRRQIGAFHLAGDIF
jgi:hypothetical protein